MSPQFTPFAMFFLFMIPIAVGSAVLPVAKKGCKEYVCGNVEIPYPFGMSEDCYLDKPFMVTCNRSHYDPPQLFLGNTFLDIKNISLEEGQLNVLYPISHKCFEPSGWSSYTTYFKFPNTFTINSARNKFTAVGCDTFAFLEGKRGDENYTTGCVSYCNSPAVTSSLCADGGCCQTSIPETMREGKFKIDRFTNLTSGAIDPSNYEYVKNSKSCSYAFVAEEGQFNVFNVSFNLTSIEKLPMVLDWEIGGENGSCKQNSCHEKNTGCQDMKRGGYRCFCKEGYRGNPYLLDIIGCQNINECEESGICSMNARCEDTEGGYKCICREGYEGDGRGKDGCSKRSSHVAWIVAGTAMGIAVLSFAFLLSYYWLRTKKFIAMRELNFRKNGGIILRQQIDGQKGSIIPPRIFSSEALKKATNNYHDSNILGEGGNGIVYKGRLTDNTEVAIKKSKAVDRKNIDQFINEVIVLTQVNHRNVVKLLGCCLEDELPLLVYEFISNGTIFEHLHDRSKSYILPWDARLRILAETADVLSYLHSAASPPIIHRDIKTTNILLDDKYTAKVADFGASRLVPLNGNEFSTVVQGTIGYLDPEYMQTNQLTEKSDVYSFGVVLAELLTGKMPVFFDESESRRSLANDFLSSLKLEQLFQILDCYIVSEDNTEQLKEVAMLAKRCLNVKGEDRPTMKEVSMELEGLRIAAKHSWMQNAYVGSEEMESLLDSQPNTLTDGDIMMIDSSNFSAKDHIMLSVANGR